MFRSVVEIYGQKATNDRQHDAKLVDYVVYPLTGELAVIWFVTGVLGFIIAGAVFAGIYKPS